MQFIQSSSCVSFLSDVALSGLYSATEWGEIVKGHFVVFAEEIQTYNFDINNIKLLN